MQHFDGEIEKYLRLGIIDYENAMHYATNAGNLKLLLSDFDESDVAPAGPEVLRQSLEAEVLDIERIKEPKATGRGVGRAFCFLAILLGAILCGRQP